MAPCIVPAVPKPRPQFVDFRFDERAPVLTVMRSLLAERDGWINLAPALEVEEVPEPPGTLARVFGPKGPMIPFGTWVPGARKRGSVEPTSLGLQHGSGPKAIGRLRDAGIRVPEGWKVLSDHPRRGVVLSLPDGTRPEDALDWLLEAAIVLTDANIDLRADWRAGIYR